MDGIYLDVLAPIQMCILKIVNSFLLRMAPYNFRILQFTRPEKRDSHRCIYVANDRYLIFWLDFYREKRRKLGGLTRSYGRACLLVDILCEDVGDSLVERFQVSTLFFRVSYQYSFYRDPDRDPAF
jgi:hypothetical protein